MTLAETELSAGHRALVLADDLVEIVLLPDKGCDIYSITDLKTGVDVLFKSPWGLLPKAPGVSPPDTASNWLRHYPGGWQLVLPNGGTASTVDGASWGFHGEASLAGWEWEPADGGLDAAAHLFYAPLSVKREVRLAAGRLHLRETVTNASPDRIEFMWGHHPAFGAPLIEPGARIATGARTYVADDEQPGPGIEPGSRHSWPHVDVVDGTLDLSVIGTDEVAYLGYLTDFEDNWFAITNPRLELGVGLRWSRGVLDHAWFWQELRASRGFPWFRRAYVAAIEPNSTYPAQGVQAARQKGGTLVELEGGSAATVDLEFSIHHESDRVIGYGDGGVVTG